MLHSLLGCIKSRRESHRGRECIETQNGDSFRKPSVILLVRTCFAVNKKKTPLNLSSTELPAPYIQST
jgi:hypothetical protein